MLIDNSTTFLHSFFLGGDTYSADAIDRKVDSFVIQFCIENKKIEHQAVVSGEATNYDDVLSSHKWGVGVILLLFIKVRTARLNGSAQNLSGVPCFWIQRSPLAPSFGTSGVGD